MFFLTLAPFQLELARFLRSVHARRAAPPGTRSMRVYLFAGSGLFTRVLFPFLLFFGDFLRFFSFSLAYLKNFPYLCTHKVLCQALKAKEGKQTTHSYEKQNFNDGSIAHLVNNHVVRPAIGV